jgi:hypothetical protein
MRIITVRWLWWAQAMTVNTALILIRPERRYDGPLLAHERHHARQMRGFGVWRFWWHYITSADFRLRVEVSAYRVQYRLNPRGLAAMGRVLATSYLLPITPERAALLISSNKKKGVRNGDGGDF